MKKHNIKTKILIVVPYYKQAEAAFISSLLSLIEYYQKQKPEYELSYKILPETVIHEARNKAAIKAGEIRADYLLFIDNDASFPPESLDKLYSVMEKKKADIVSGLFFKREPPFHPTSLMRLELNEKEKEVRYIALQDWPDGKLVEIDGCGMHFTLINTKLFNKIPQPWFSFREGVGEDLYFCFLAKVKAKAKIYCDTSCHIGHIGRMPVGINTFRQHRGFEKEEKLKNIEKLKISNL